MTIELGAATGIISSINNIFANIGGFVADILSKIGIEERAALGFMVTLWVISKLWDKARYG